MTRNIWWVAAGVLALLMAGVVRAEEPKKDSAPKCCCEGKDKKDCTCDTCKCEKKADEKPKCTCDGKDKKNCKCDTCKCGKSADKCTCEGKDKKNCTCDECNCVKKAVKNVLGTRNVVVLVLKVLPKVQAAVKAEASAKHNHASTKGSEEGCSVGQCPFVARPRHAPLMPPCIPLPPIGMMPVPPPLPAPPIPYIERLFTNVGPVRPGMVFTHPVPQAPIVRYETAVAVPVPPSIRFVANDEQVKMEMPQGDTSVTSERMEIKVGDRCTVEMSADEGQVRIRCECLEARADSIIKAGKGDRIVLEGHVKFEYHKDGQEVGAVADRLVFDPATGHFEIKTSSK